MANSTTVGLGETGESCKESEAGEVTGRIPFVCPPLTPSLPLPTQMESLLWFEI